MKTMSIQRWQEASSSVLLKILPTPTSCKYEVLKENGFAKIKALKPSHWCEWYRAKCPGATQILKRPTHPCQPLSALVNPCHQQEIHHKTRSWKVNSFSHPVLTANRFYINEMGSFISFLPVSSKNMCEASPIDLCLLPCDWRLASLQSNF